MPDSRELPRISIVTPSYNQGRYLERTIRSVLDQNYPNLEYMIVDGGSTDDSLAIIKRYESCLSYWVSEPDRGQSHAINKGLLRATGSILAWLNSDDYYLPGTLSTIAEAALASPESGAFVGIGEIVDATGKVTYHREPAPVITIDTVYHWATGGDFMQPSCFFRDDIWRAVAPVDESIHMAFDFDLWVRMLKAGCTFKPIDRLLSQALTHPHAKTTAYSNLMMVDLAIVAIRHGGEHVVRHTLDDMATRLSWSEANLNKILNNPIIKVLEPLIRLFVKPAVVRRDTIPPWLRP